MAKKVLIVDDQQKVRELLKVTLEFEDYQIFMAANGEQTLAMAQVEQPNIIFLDIVMPGSDLDGLEVCHRLKSDPSTAKIHVALISAKGQQKDIEAGHSAGADDYFVKPFSPLALVQKVSELMR
jgi:CheY-like chemotaxis protein